MRTSPIGIFDSGIGGLTLAHAIKENLPKEHIIYFGDTKHLPYGEKSELSIQYFSKKICEFLLSQKCKAIIIACNSASSVAYDHVKNIARKTPVFNVIDPIVKTISNNYKNCKIGIIGTKATIKSRVYYSKIMAKDKNQEVYSLSTPLLAPMIEEGFFNEEISKAVIQNYLNDPILKDIDSLILACTHYPLIQNEINEFYNKKVKVIDSVKIVAKSISEDLENLDLLNNDSCPKYHFYVSNYTESFEKSSYLFFKEKIHLEEINLDL